MTATYFRVLAIPLGVDKDAEGRCLGDDWMVADFGEDETARYYLTTDRVRCSETTDLYGFDPKTAVKVCAMALNVANRNRPVGASSAWLIEQLTLAFGEVQVVPSEPKDE